MITVRRKAELCDCGSGKPVMSTGRCRSCASRLANVTRKKNAREALPSGAEKTTGLDRSVTQLREEVRLFTGVPRQFLSSMVEIGAASEDLLLELRGLLSGRSSLDIPVVDEGLQQWVCAAAIQLRAVHLLGRDAEPFVADVSERDRTSDVVAAELHRLSRELDLLYRR